MTAAPDAIDLSSYSFADLTKLIARAEARRTELRPKMHAQLEKDAEVLGYSIQENGKPKRKRPTNPLKEPE